MEKKVEMFEQGENQENLKLDNENETSLVETPKAEIEELPLEQQITSIDIEELEKYFDKLYKNQNEESLLSILTKSVIGGKNSLSQKAFIYTMDIDGTWIKAIEDAMDAMEVICNNPKSVLKGEYELVKVEKAKRVDHVAVKYLSTHTNYIKSIKPDGSIVPSEVLTKNYEDSIATYENRFVYTLIKRIKVFLHSKYEEIKGKLINKNSTILNYDSQFKCGTANIKCKLELNVDTPTRTNTPTYKTNDELMKTINHLMLRLKVLEKTKFCITLRNAKQVLPPIQKTNVLIKNIYYYSCYKAWLLISSYTATGYTVKIIEKDLPFSKSYCEDLAKVIAMSTEVMLVNDQVKKAVFKNLRAKKVIKQTYDFNKIKISASKYKYDRLSTVPYDVDAFYYDRMKKLASGMTSKVGKVGNEDGEAVEKKVNLTKVVRHVEGISNKIYEEVLKTVPEKRIYKRQSDKIAYDLKQQKVYNKNLQTVLEIKEAELNKLKLALKTQNKKATDLEHLYLEKLKSEKLAEKQAKEKLRLAREKKRLEALNKQKRARQRELERQKRLRLKEQEEKKKLLQKEKEKLKQQKLHDERELEKRRITHSGNHKKKSAVKQNGTKQTSKIEKSQTTTVNSNVKIKTQGTKVVESGKKQIKKRAITKKDTSFEIKNNNSSSSKSKSIKKKRPMHKKNVKEHKDETKVN